MPVENKNFALVDFLFQNSTYLIKKKTQRNLKKERAFTYLTETICFALGHYFYDSNIFLKITSFKHQRQSTKKGIEYSCAYNVNLKNSQLNYEE